MKGFDCLDLLIVIRFGLPGAELIRWHDKHMLAEVRWAGHHLGISICGIDGYPVLLVVTNNFEMNEVTAKALEMLDSVMPEVVRTPRPWPDLDSLRDRLRELQDEGGDDDPA